MSRGRSNFADESWGGAGKKKTIDMELDITPMIDVTFLLLIFFMVSSTMQPTPDLQVPAAKHGKPLDTKDATVFFVSQGSKTQLPVITYGNSNNEIALEQVEATVAQASQEGKKHVIVRGDGRAPSGFIDDLLREVSKVEGVTFSIGVRDKKRGGS